MCGIYHSIIRLQSGWIKAHMCGKNHCQFVFLQSGKNQTCGFYQTHTKYKCVWKKPHMCVKRQTCVSFSIQEVVLFVFAIVFRIFKRIYYIISPSVISEVTMQCQKSETSSNQPWKKSPVWEFPHMCGKNHTG